MNIDPALEKEAKSILKPRENAYDSEPESEIDEVVDEVEGAQGSSTAELGLKATISNLAANDRNLIELKLDGIDLVGNSDTDAMFDALATNTVVTRLLFDNTYADDTLVEALSLALITNQTVTHVSLRDNEITSEGCEYVSACMLNFIWPACWRMLFGFNHSCNFELDSLSNYSFARPLLKHSFLEC